jgi:hypothetical protein
MTEAVAPPPRPTRRRRLRDHAPEVLVEGFTMTLYVSLSLLAVVLAMSSEHASAGENAQLILLTVTGLVLAHLVAFRLSARMVHGGNLPAESPEIVIAQVVGGLVVAVLAAGPVLILGPVLGTTVAELLLLGVVALAGYTVAAKAGMPLGRRLLYVGGVVLLVAVILAVKAAAGH